MGLFLTIIGFLMVPVAIAWLIFSFLKKKKKLIPSLSIVAGILICFTGLMIVGANVTPEELARIEEDKKAREKAKEEKLEAARLEKEKEAKQKELAEKNKKAEEEDKLKEQQQEKERAQTEEKEKENIKTAQTEKNPQDDSIEVKAKEIAYEIFKFSKNPIDETVQEVNYDEDEKTLSIKVKGKDGWSDKSIGLGFYDDSTTFYREISKDQSLQEVWLTITFPMQDVYGNIEDEEVMSTWMSRETMDKINWKSFDYQKLLDVVDGKRIYPQFVQ